MEHLPARRYTAYAIAGAVLSPILGWWLMGARSLVGAAVGGVLPWLVFWLLARWSEPARARRAEQRMLTLYYEREASVAEMALEYGAGRVHRSVNPAEYDRWLRERLDRTPIDVHQVSASELSYGDVVVGTSDIVEATSTPGKFLTSPGRSYVLYVTPTGVPGQERIRVELSDRTSTSVEPGEAFSVLRAADEPANSVTPLRYCE